MTHEKKKSRRILAALATLVVALSAVAEPAIQQNELVQTNGEFQDLFGASVSHDGAFGLVGNFAADDVGQLAGAAYLYDLVDGKELMKFLPGPDSSFFRFGNSVSISGSLALIGAPLDDSNGEHAGSAYLFDITTGEFLRKLINPNPPFGGSIPGECFGASVAIHGNRAIIGAPDNVILPIASVGSGEEEFLGLV